MKIALASDLHLEFGDIDLKNTENADVLILAGDICIAEELHALHKVCVTHDKCVEVLTPTQIIGMNYREFFKRCSKEFKHVVYVAGNHEFYHGKWQRNIQDLRNECDNYDNIHFLERDMVVIDDVTFVGGTLWTDCNNRDPLTLQALQDMMNDFDYIKNDDRGYTSLRPAHTIHRHDQTVSYIKEIIRDKNRVVVVGHHAPSFMSINERYKNQLLMNGGYASDLSEMILDNPQIKLWVHGHVHNKFDYMIGSTRVVCNPRGYINFENSADNFELEYIVV